MNNFSFSRGSVRGSLCCLLTAGIVVQAALAQDTTKNLILQSKADEQDVRQHTAAVVAEAQALIDEMAANGITGDDVKVLNATKAALTNLSGPEMDRIIGSLQKAGEATTDKGTEQQAISAYAGEKGIIMQFRQILKDYEERQAAYELPLRFKDLANRQDDTLNTTIAVARKSAGKSAVELSTMDQTTQQIAQADQDAIANEVTLAEQQLDKAAKESTDDTAKNIQQAEKDIQTGTMQKALDEANDALKAGQLLKAITAQKIARDELHKVAEDLSPPANAVDALSATAASIAKIIEEQKNLMKETTASVDIKPRVTGLDDKQGVIVNETDSLQQDTQTLSATTAGMVKDAIVPMQASRTQLGPQGRGPESFTKAASSQEEAIEKLEAAEAQVNKELADAQKAADADAKDPVAEMQDLLQQIQAALQQQKQLDSQTARAVPTNSATMPNPADAKQIQQAQSQLQQTASTLQQTAQPLSLPSSQALGDAAHQMDLAQQALGSPTILPQQAEATQSAQQAAEQALERAIQLLNQDIAQAQQTPPDAAALAQAANSLQQAQNDVSNAIAATPPAAAAAAQAAGAQAPAAGGAQAGAAQAAAGGAQAGAQAPAGGAPPAGAPPAGGDMAAAAAALAQAAKDTNAAAQTPGLPAAAAAAVKDAQGAIAQGQQAAAKGDAPATAADAAAAEQALASAQSAVAIAQAGMAGSGPPPPGGTGSGPPENGPPGSGPPEAGAQPGDTAATGLSGGSTEAGKLHDTLGKGKFVSVAARDRAAIDQTQTEKRPQEFAPMIDQYMKNLSDQASSSP